MMPAIIKGTKKAVTIGAASGNLTVEKDDTQAITKRRASGMLCDPECETCRGLGYFRIEMEDIYHPYFGKQFQCPNIDIDVMMPEYAKEIGLTKEERETLSWNSIKKLPNGSNIAEAIEATKLLLNRGHGWLYLWGDWGLGKSLVLQIATALAFRAGLPAKYVRMIDIMDEVKESFESEAVEAEIMRRYAETQIIALDEIEKIVKGPWGENRRWKFLDTRYIQATREQTITIIAGNVPPDSLPGELRDRIREGRFDVIEMKGTSARPMMLWKDGTDGKGKIY